VEEVEAEKKVGMSATMEGSGGNSLEEF